MLKLTRKLEYSLIALSHMQHKGENELSSSKEIAKKFSIPQEILAKTLQQLAKSEIIHAVQGPYGGYKVKRSLDDFSFMDFISVASQLVPSRAHNNKKKKILLSLEDI